MDLVRTKEQQAERIAHLLDDRSHIPGTSIRFGLDPILGLVPVIGDVIVTAWGAAILVIARQLGMPASVVLRMGSHLLINGLVGTVPLFGDLYSVGYKSHAKNAALLLWTVKRGEEGACRLTTRSLNVGDVALLLTLIVPILAAVGFAAFWLWEHNISLLSLFFPPLYQSHKPV